MPATVIVRGNLILFSATFLDAGDEPVTPSAVNLHLTFHRPSNEQVDLAPIEMHPDSEGQYAVTWDSSVAYRGMLYWAIKATSPAAAEQGHVDLAANIANPDPDESE